MLSPSTIDLESQLATAKKKARTLEQIHADIKRLEQEAKAVRDAEVAEVVAKMKSAIEHYGLTAADLGLGSKAGRKSGMAKAAPVPKARKKGAASKTPRQVKYRDEAGNAWVGHGKRPRWFVEALAAGKSAEDLLAK